MGFFQRLPDGIYPPKETYHNALNFENKATMHQAMVKSHGWEFVDALECGHYYTDFRFEVVSKMFLPSIRDQGCKYFKIHFNICLNQLIQHSAVRIFSNVITS